MLALVLVLAVVAQSNPAAQTRDTRTWYQAYADAQRNVQQRNWQAALNDLDAAARLGAPRPGRNINFYGDVYRDYNPDYYRGVALSNLERYQEADQAFERVRQAQLITQRDSLFAEFNRQATNVKGAVEKLAASRPPGSVPAAPSGSRIDEPGTTTAQRGVTPAGVTPQGVNASGVNAAVVPASPVTAPGAAPGAAPVNVDPRNAAPAAVNTANADPANAVVQQGPPPAQPQTQAQAAAPPVRTVPPRTTTSARATPAAQVRPPAARDPAPFDERAPLLMYFSGDYTGAAGALTRVVQAPGASRRSYLYLAFSRTAMVLSGQAPRSDLDEARRLLAQAGELTPYARDLALISPRVRQELGIQQ